MSFIEDLVRAINETVAAREFGADFRTRIPRENIQRELEKLRLSTASRGEDVLQRRAEGAGLSPVDFLAQSQGADEDLKRLLVLSQAGNYQSLAADRNRPPTPKMVRVEIPDPADPAKPRVIMVPESDPRLQGEGIPGYSKPPAASSGAQPRTQIIQTDHGFIPVTIPPGGGRPQVQPALEGLTPRSTAPERKEARSFQAIRTLVDKLMDLSLGALDPATGQRDNSGINSGSGVTQKIGGGLDYLQSKVGLDDRVAFYRRQIRGFVPMLARLVGHSGVLTEIDVNRTEDLFPKAGDSNDLASNLWQGLLDIIEGRQPIILTPTDDYGNPTGPPRPYWVGGGEGEQDPGGAGPGGIPQGGSLGTTVPGTGIPNPLNLPPPGGGR